MILSERIRSIREQKNMTQGDIDREGPDGAGLAAAEPKEAPPPPPSSAMRRPPKKYRRAL